MFKITDGKGFQMTFANGWTASVQWGFGTYSDNKYAHDTGGNFHAFQSKLGAKGSETAEVAAWQGDGMLHYFDGWDDNVKGYCTADEVAEFLAMVAAMPASPEVTNL